MTRVPHTDLAAPQRCTLTSLMNVRFFVTGTASLLAVWLAATFMTDVPVERYPQYGKGSVPVSAKAAKPKLDKTAETAKAEERPVAIFE